MSADTSKLALYRCVCMCVCVCVCVYTTAVSGTGLVGTAGSSETPPNNYVMVVSCHCGQMWWSEPWRTVVECVRLISTDVPEGRAHNLAFLRILMIAYKHAVKFLERVPSLWLFELPTSPRVVPEQSQSWDTGLFISPSGISELDFATTKTDTAERSISIGRESLPSFFLY